MWAAVPAGPSRIPGKVPDGRCCAGAQVIKGVYISTALEQAQPFERFQWERLGFFCVDPDSRPGALVFNRTVTFTDSFAGKK